MNKIVIMLLLVVPIYCIKHSVVLNGTQLLRLNSHLIQYSQKHVHGIWFIIKTKGQF